MPLWILEQAVTGWVQDSSIELLQKQFRNIPMLRWHRESVCAGDSTADVENVVYQSAAVRSGRTLGTALLAALVRTIRHLERTCRMGRTV